MNYSNCCGVETHAERGELIKCSACKEWSVAESDYEESNFWKYVPKIVTLIAVIYFATHFVVWMIK